MAEPNPAFKQIDRAFAAIVTGLQQLVIESAGQAVTHVLQLSSEFLDEDTQKAISEFHRLYTSSTQISQPQEDLNRDLDDFISGLQERIAHGEEIDVAVEKSKSNQDQENLRIGLASLQRRLEGIIHLGEGIREKLLPVLSSLQFEELIRHRLSHLQTTWQGLLDCRHLGTVSADRLAETLAGLLSSNAEREIFYRIVLKRPPPLGLEDSQLIFDTLRGEN